MHAPTYPLVVLARVVAALGAAVCTPGATVAATRLNPPEHRGRAVATVFGGITLALVVGVPAGTLLGGPLGDHGVFALGLAGWTANAPILRRSVALSPGGSGLLLSLNASAIHLGAGPSGAVGGLLIGWVGITATPPVAAALVAFAVALFALRSREVAVAPHSDSVHP